MIEKKQFLTKIKDYKIKKKTHIKVYILLFFIRLINSFSIKTFYQPDEYYQVLEPAHKFVFGYGFETWEYKQNLRSSILPLLYSVCFKLSFLINDKVRSKSFIFYGPKILNALIGSTIDFLTFKFALLYTKNNVLSFITLALSIFNSYNWIFMTRSFSNVFETLLILLGFLYWPFDKKKNFTQYFKSCFFFSTCLFIRPTSFLVWFYLSINFLVNNLNNLKIIIKYGFLVLFETVIISIMNLILDYWFYGMYVFPMYKFLKFNLINGLSDFYGVSSVYYYFSEAIPFMTLTYFPFLIYSLIVLKKIKSILGQVSVFVVLIFSLINHKETRFIFILQPFFLILSSYSVMKLIHFSSKCAKLLLIVTIIINIITGFFFTQINEKGVIDLMTYINRNNQVKSFGLLMPCHSTPWQSHIHDSDLFFNSWFLKCDPPLEKSKNSKQNLNLFKDDTDLFYSNPIEFLEKNLDTVKNGFESKKKYFWPTHLVLFENLQSTLHSYLVAKKYTQCKKIFNSFFHWDPRRRGYLIVYCKK